MEVMFDNEEKPIYSKAVKGFPNSNTTSQFCLHLDDSKHELILKRRRVNFCGAENNSATCDCSEVTDSDQKKMLSESSPFSDMIIFKYCLGSPTERCHLLKEIAISASEQQIENFAEQVSMFTGCSHHRHQIKISKRLVEEGIQAWISMSENNNQALWKNAVPIINQHFRRIACCSRSLTDQDFECLKRIAGCRDIIYQESFERMWSWLFPVAFTVSRKAVNLTWDSVSPKWMEGFITKEEAEFALQGPHALQDPGTFVVRFPASRSWPHPDAGQLVVTYVGSDYTIHHRLLSHDFLNSLSSEETSAKTLQDMLLQEPELSRLGRILRSH